MQRRRKKKEEEEEEERKSTLLPSFLHYILISILTPSIPTKIRAHSEEEEEEEKKKKKKKERAHCYPHSSITSSSPQVYQLNLEHTQSQTLPCVFTPIS